MTSAEKKLTTQEAADHLALSKSTLRANAHAGRIPFARFADNGNMYFRLVDLDTFWERHQEQGQERQAG